MHPGTHDGLASSDLEFQVQGAILKVSRNLSMSGKEVKARKNTQYNIFD